MNTKQFTMSSVPVAVLMKCANFAAIKHQNQRRKDSEESPYINHPIGVAYSLTEEGGVTHLVVIQAALLHDTVEDTDCTIEEIKEHFGAEVAGVVAEVTDDKNKEKMVRKQLQIETAPHKSPRAKLVKLADKLYNLRDLERCTPTGWTEERVEDYFHWAAQVVKGLRGSNSKLEAELDKLLKKHGVLELSK